MDKVIKDVLEKIENNNFQAYVVGGYVRDFLRKKPNNDIDITTNATPKELLKIFDDKNLKLEDYGNVFFKIDNYNFEITTFRKELSYKNNRKVASIEYVNSYKEDIIRRDFTINSICMDKNGNIIDILNGRKDLHKKIIRSIGDPKYKLKEDSLRILRAIRFACILNYKIDNELKLAIHENKELLRTLSYERKKDELTKIFNSDNKKYGVRLLKELNLLDVLELKNIDNVLLTKDPIGMWATIASFNYPFTKLEKEIINDINNLLQEDIKNPFVMYKYGSYILSIVSDLKKLNKKKILKCYDNLPIKDKSEIKITSEEICNLFNKEPGPFLKNVLEKIEISILNGNVKNDNEALKKYVLEQII